ncbi:MAG: tetratricopeptide repeat protein, partial [Pseudomonadales bacterium]
MLTAARAQRCLKDAKQYLATDVDRSLENSTRLLDAGIENAEVLHLASTALLKKGKYPQATGLLNKLLDHNTTSIDTYTYLVSCHAATANFSALARLLDRIQGIDAAGVDWTLLKIRIMNLLKMHAPAAALCVELVEQEPDNTEFHCMLGWHYQSLGDLSRAQKSYRAALAINPDTVRALYALSYLKKWDSEDNNLAALQGFLQRGAGSESDLTFVYSALGKEYEDIAQYSAAFENFKNSADLTNKTT